MIIMLLTQYLRIDVSPGNELIATTFEVAHVIVLGITVRPASMNGSAFRLTLISVTSRLLFIGT
jgi:hypothetical protein